MAHIQSTDVTPRALIDLEFAELRQMDLIRSICNSKEAVAEEEIRDRRVLAQAHGAMGLDSPVANALGHHWRDHLDRRNKIASALATISVDGMRGLQSQQPRLLYLAVGPRDVLPDAAVIRENATKRRTLGDPLRHDFECTLRLANRTHAVMNPSGTEATWRYLEPSTFAEDQIGIRHSPSDLISKITDGTIS